MGAGHGGTMATPFFSMVMSPQQDDSFWSVLCAGFRLSYVQVLVCFQRPCHHQRKCSFVMKLQWQHGF